MTTEISGRLNIREHANVQVVAAGQAEPLVGDEANLTVDGYWCDHAAVHALVVAGMVRPVA